MTEQTEPKRLPPNTVRAHLLPGVNIKPENHIRQAELKRNWMDDVPKQYIYRCIPLLAANTMGWELLNPTESTVIWDGGNATPNIKISTPGRNRFSAASHFGSAMVTWYIPYLFRTSADLGLLITGPANHEHNYAVPLEAFVRTDWLPFPFTLNWRMTERNQPVTFKVGEPIACVKPYPLTMLQETNFELSNLVDDPGFLEEVNEFGRARQANVAKQQADAAKAAVTGEELTGDGVWNAQYVKAKGKKGEFAKHQTVFKCPKPKEI